MNFRTAGHFRTTQTTKKTELTTVKKVRDDAFRESLVRDKAATITEYYIINQHINNNSEGVRDEMLFS